MRVLIEDVVDELELSSLPCLPSDSPFILCPERMSHFVHKQQFYLFPHSIYITDDHLLFHYKLYLRKAHSLQHKMRQRVIKTIQLRHSPLNFLPSYPFCKTTFLQMTPFCVILLFLTIYTYPLQNLEVAFVQF